MGTVMTIDEKTSSQSAVDATQNLPHVTTVGSETLGESDSRMWTPNLVTRLLREVAVDGVCSSVRAYERAHSLPSMARKLFGSFSNACHASDLRSASEAKPKYLKCTIPGCDMNVRSSGTAYCEMHYGRFRRNGHSGLRQIPLLRVHTQGYLQVFAPSHPLAKRQGRSREYQHRVVYYDHHGEGPFECNWCGKPVTWKTMHVDHVNGDRQDNRIENLVASCPKCNSWRDEEKNLRALRNKIGKKLSFDGETKTVSEWARQVGIAHSSMNARLQRG
jgi:hypothetical protein